MKTKVHTIDGEITADEPLFIGAVNSIQNEKSLYKILLVEGNEIKFKVDTGSQANILPLSVFTKMNIKQHRLEQSTTKLSSYTGEFLPVVGQCSLECNNTMVNFVVVKTDQDPIIGLKSSQDLNLIKIVLNVNKLCDKPATNIPDKFPSVFHGLGCLKETYRIKVDPTVTPVVNPLRSTPVALREKLKKSLKEMEKTGVVEKVECPTKWVNSAVIIEKPDSEKLRICLDPRPLNEAIQREHFKMPTIEEITTRVAGAKVFSKLDANHGYWQIPLDEESRLLTTFNTPFKRYCYKRMPFGIKSAQEVFQKRMCQAFGDLEGVETDVDDILVWGATIQEHDDRLMKTLQRCEEINLTLNRDKCEFRVKEVIYIGHKLTAEGVKPDEQKVEAIKRMPPPEDKKGTERLLGVVNYLAKFVPNMSTITKPIRELLRSDVEFQWGDAQEKAFQEVKDVLTKAPVLAYYDVKKPVKVTCDASKCGLGAALLQDDKPVAFASRALTDAEMRYAQIEKELLAVVFAFEKFNQYTYGRCVEVETDHKPLVSIVKKSLTSAPPRLQRMLLRLQRYEIKMTYKPGKEMIIADTLSRAYLTDKDTNNDQMNDEIEGFVHAVVNRIPVSEEGLEQIRKETARDETMQLLTSTIRTGWPETRKQVSSTIQDFWNYRDELTEIQGILLKQDKIIIPSNLRKTMLEKIHQSHLGMEKCKRRTRDIMFWPQMNEQIEAVVSKCETCQEYQMSNPKEPMVQAPIPSRPWQMVATDLFMWEQNNYMVVVDYYSRYIEVAKLENTTSRTVVNHTKSHS